MPEIEIIEVIVPGPQGAKGATGAATEEALAARDEAVAVAAAAGKWLPSQDVIEADATLPPATAAGTVVRTLDGYGYDVLAPAAPSYARLTSAGVKLGVRSDKGEWYAKAFGIADIGTDQRAKVQKMLDSGEQAFVFEATNDRIALDGNVVVPANCSMRGGRFDQKTRGHPTIDIAKGIDGVRLRDMNFAGSYSRAYAGTAYRGDNLFGQNCAVWVGANNTIIENITVSDMVTAVWLSCWDDGANANVVGRSGNCVRGLRVKNVDFGILAKGQVGMMLLDLYGEDIVLSPGSPNPGHLVYVTGDLTTRSTGLVIANAMGLRANDQTIVQVKWTDGASISNICGYDAALLSITGSNNVTVAGITGKEITDVSGSGAIKLYAQDDNEANLPTGVKITGVDYAMKSGQTRPASLFGHKIVFDARIETNRPSNYSDAAVHVAGLDNEVNLHLTQSGAGAQQGVYLRTQAWMTAGTKRTKVRMRGAFGGGAAFKMPDAGVEDSILEYDPQHITTLATTAMFNDHAATRSTVRRGPSEVTQTGAGGSGLAFASGSVFSAAANSRVTFNITDASNYTLPAPPRSTNTQTPIGMEIEVMVKNSSAGALGTITWNASYDLKAAYVAPAAGKRTLHRFRWTGTVWEEQ